MQNFVFQLDSNKKPLDMVHPAKARKLQSQGKAATFRMYPYTIIRDVSFKSPNTKKYILKIDPGSIWTGFAIQCGEEIVFKMELKHRGELIKEKLEARKGFRRGRRSRNLRYRKPRFDRRKPKGWLAPSLRHRLQTVETWIKKFLKFCPITCIEIEQVRFDLQKLENPEISGLEYQQGELFGYEVLEFLLEKWGRKCAYCGITDVPFEVEHIKPKSKGGSNRISNLTISCHNCNQAKGNQKIEDFLSGKPDILKRIQSQTKKPLADASAVNSTRFAIVEMAKSHCDQVNCWTGGRTKYNRISQGLPKSHSIDAACVGESGAKIKVLIDKPLIVESKGHGTKQFRRSNASGFPALNKNKQPISPKTVYTHCQAGDMIKFWIDKSRKSVKAGIYKGRVKTPTPKGFEIKINGFRVSQKMNYLIRFMHRNDGYAYSY